MGEPVIIAREAHSISRKQIDPDALKVLYRLHQSNYVAYLVGGSVRDLLLGRRPKDFDIGTSAHPYQVKKLFRNCWIIGRRFRLAHVRFGTEDDRGRDLPASGDAGGARRRRKSLSRTIPATRCRGRRGTRPPAPSRQHVRHAGRGRVPPRLHHQRAVLRHRDFSIIDYTGGLDDLRAGLVRCIGDPDGAVPGRSGPDAARGRDGRAARLHDRSADRRGDRAHARRDRAQRAGAPDRGVLQAAARRVRRSRRSGCWPSGGCSNRSRTSCSGAPTTRCGDRSPRSTPTGAASKTPRTR